MANLDKFYTKPDIAEQCYNYLLSHYDVADKIFLEPSAGNGVFLQYLKNYIALDIKPENEFITQMNFFEFSNNDKHLITIGNPPFGKRSTLAIKFFNHAAEVSDIIGFIVPVSFMKWSVQKQLNSNFALVDYFYLEPNSFLDGDKDFNVRCVFQIWVNKESDYMIPQDLRLSKQPPIKHPDFNIWQYNATQQALKTVEENWEIATYRQGYHNYNEKFSHEDYDLVKDRMTGEHKQQFFFIQPLTEEARKIILSMDFNALAERNTSTPGFGKGDFVQYYTELKG